MTIRSRESRVLAVLVVSVLAGAVVLSALSHNPLSANAFCLSQYYHLNSVAESVGSGTRQYPGRWEKIEIHYGDYGVPSERTKREIDRSLQNSSPAGCVSAGGGADCHFIICDGYAGRDGQIKATESWNSQFASDHTKQKRPEPFDEMGRTIHICIVATDKNAVPTDSQLGRTEALVQELCRRFRIRPDAIRYPGKTE